MTAVLREDFLPGASPAFLSALLTPGATSLSVGVGQLASWTPVIHGRIPVTINDGMENEERMYATAVSGDSLTGLVRGTSVDGTAEQTHAPGSRVTVGLLARHVDTANEFLSMPQAKGDLAVASTADTWARQAAGPDGSVLAAASGQPNGVEWTDDLNLGAGSLVLPQTTVPAQTAEGSAVWDTNDDVLTIGTGAGRKTLVNTDSTQTLTGKTFDPGNTWTSGTVNLANGVLVVPLAATPSQTSEGEMVWDNDSDLLTVGDGAGRKTMVDTSSTQTLSGKTLTAPTIADFTNAQHDHGDADDGGALAASIPLGNLGKTQNVLDVTGVTAEIVLAALSVTVGTNRKVRLEWSGLLGTDTAGDLAKVRIRNGLTTAGTELQRAQRKITTSGGPGQETLTFFVEGTFSGEQSFCVTLERVFGTGALSLLAAPSSPSQLRVDDVGGA